MILKAIRYALQVRWLSQKAHFRFIRRIARRIMVNSFCHIYRYGYALEVCNGIYLRLDPNFLLSVTSVSEDVLLHVMLRQLRQGDIVVDVGGWVGIYALCAAKIVGLLGKVYVFEPAPETYNL